jgi:hypothetical protein
MRARSSCRSDSGAHLHRHVVCDAGGIAILATLVANARFGWDGHHAPEPISRVTLRPKGGMPLAVWPREAMA